MYRLDITDSEYRVLRQRWGEIVKAIAALHEEDIQEEDIYDEDELRSIMIKLQVSLPVKPHNRLK